jgi:three-Cys-motif partner protein
MAAVLLMTSSAEFFEEARQQSRIKSRIVAKYFWAWARVISSTMKGQGSRIAYMDLFAGPGKYKDETPSTPVIVLQKAIKDPRLREMLVTVFNDKTAEFARSLQNTIDAIPGIETLKYKPRVENEEVGQKIVESLQGTRLIPTLLFADPWGYKGLSIALISSVLQNWGCDCLFFFNYNRINPGLNNEIVREHMNDLFGEKRADAIREKLIGLHPDERETLIVEELSMALKECGIAYVLPFTFKSEEGTRTTHHLIFASKHFKGYEIMKEIMAKESSEQDQGVPSFAYFAASEKHQILFEFLRPLSDLEELLLVHFAGQKLSMYQVYERHNVGRRFIKTNYKKALTRLEANDKIKAEPPSAKRPKKRGEVTFADDVVVTFPKKAKI